MKYFTLKQDFFLYSSDIPLKEMNKIKNFLELLDESGVHKIIEKTSMKENLCGRKSYNKFNLFAVIIYAFSKNITTLREIEEACQLRLDFKIIMENDTPSYVVFAEFINNIILPNLKEIFKLLTIQLIKRMDINIDDVFLDGSKFEANANKYKFVFKPRKNLENLNLKILEITNRYGVSFESNKPNIQSLSLFLNFLKKEIGEKEIIRGKGKRLTQIEKDYIKTQEYLIKLEEYEEKIRICGPNRNSYSKSDEDATQMCLKEDYYSGLGSNMHAAYNVQLVVSKGIILAVYVSQDRNDYFTLIPTLNLYHSLYEKYPKNLCADSGYGSFSNYEFLKSKNIVNFVKYPSRQLEREGRSPQLFHNIDGKIVCLNGKIGDEYQNNERHVKNKNSKFYIFKGCSRCKYKEICKKLLKKKTGNFRIAEINKDYLTFLDEARENLLSPKGIEMRVNRSIQVEGDFGIIKQDLKYSRFRRRKLDRVTLEITLIALALSFRKFFRFIDKGKLPDYWIAPKDLQPEVQKPIKLKLKKKNKLSINKKAIKNYKYTRQKKTVKS